MHKKCTKLRGTFPIRFMQCVMLANRKTYSSPTMKPPLIERRKRAIPAPSPPTKRTLSAHRWSSISLPRLTTLVACQRHSPTPQERAITLATYAHEDLRQRASITRSNGASLWVADLGEAFQGSDAMARIIEDFQTTRQHEPTRAARDKLKNCPKESAAAGRRNPFPKAAKKNLTRSGQ